MGRPLKVAIGDRFEKLLVTSIEPGDERGPIAVCQCDCGNVTRIKTYVVTRYKSCGCSRSARAALNLEPRKNALPHGRAFLNRMYGTYVAQAKKRGLQWNLSPDRFEVLVRAPCYYCGAPPSQRPKRMFNGTVPVNGIDRVRNEEGYTPLNCVPCCPECNRIKHAKTRHFYIRHCLRVVCHSLPEVKEVLVEQFPQVAKLLTDSTAG